MCIVFSLIIVVGLIATVVGIVGINSESRTKYQRKPIRVAKLQRGVVVRDVAERNERIDVRRFASKQKSIYDWNEEDFRRKYGEHWDVASKIIEARKELIRDGLQQNWDLIREHWDRSELATDNQIAMLIGGEVEVRGNLTKYEASFMIDELFLDMDVRRELDRIKREEQRAAEREAKRIAKEKEKFERQAQREKAREQARIEKEEQKQREREQRAAQRELDREERNRQRLLKTRIRQSSEFTDLWNQIVDDNVIEPEELLRVKKWLSGHKRSKEDYKDMFSLIENVLEDGAVDEKESIALYKEVVKVVGFLSGEVN